jgi:hypothetical protein
MPLDGTLDELAKLPVTCWRHPRATHQDIQQLATNVEIKLTALQMLFEQSNESHGIRKVKNLKKTVSSAATVIAGDSTDVANLEESNDYLSDFGDWFRSEASQNTLDWIYADDRKEPLFILDGLPKDLLSDRSLNRANGRTLPVHGGTKSASLAATSQLHLDLSHESITSSPSFSSSTVTKKHESTAPGVSVALDKTGTPEEINLGATTIKTPLPAAKGVEARENGNESSDEADLGRSMTKKSTTSSPKPRRKRMSWLRFGRSSSTVTARGPMMDESKSTIPKWRRADIPRRLKVVFVGDGACGKTCLLM